MNNLVIGVSVIAEEGGKALAHGLSPAAPILFKLGPFVVTNSMFTSWIVAVIVILFCRYAMRRPQIVPTGAQNFIEAVIEGLYNFFTGILGEKLTRRTFWFFITLFIFITVTNYFGLLPGVGSIGWGIGEHWYDLHLTRPLFRGANADLNMTFAMALLFFVLWFIWALRENGIIGFLKHLFGVKGDLSGGLRLLMAVVFFFAGLIELVSILLRPVALSFRLYGNIFAGENMIETITTLSPLLGWAMAVPFYFLELLVGIVQALVFSLLCAAFLLVDTMHEEH